MKEHKVTTVLFDGILQEREIPSFRGAVMALADNNPLYHNHTDDAGFQFRYPLVQYKVLDEHPALVGIDEGADSLESLFRIGEEHELQIGRTRRIFLVTDKSSTFFLADETAPGIFRYFIRNWLPFNRDNYQAWMDMPSLARRVSLLDSILCGNILTLYKAFGVFFDREVHAIVVDMSPSRNVTYKGVKMLAFDVMVETDSALPVHCGIGKGVSHGFGVVEELHRD